MNETFWAVLISAVLFIGLIVIASALDRNSKKHGNLFTTPASPTMRILAIFLGLLFAGMFVLEITSFNYVHVLPPILSIAMFAYAIGFNKFLVELQNIRKSDRDNDTPKE
jgi:prepilin signal peptidase PulO-like enzyme (type II secretory pathway)